MAPLFSDQTPQLFQPFTRQSFKSSDHSYHSSLCSFCSASSWSCSAPNCTPHSSSLSSSLRQSWGALQRLEAISLSVYLNITLLFSTRVCDQPWYFYIFLSTPLKLGSDSFYILWLHVQLLLARRCSLHNIRLPGLIEITLW